MNIGYKKYSDGTIEETGNREDNPLVILDNINELFNEGFLISKARFCNSIDFKNGTTFNVRDSKITPTGLKLYVNGGLTLKVPVENFLEFDNYGKGEIRRPTTLYYKASRPVYGGGYTGSEDGTEMAYELFYEDNELSLEFRKVI